MTYIITYLLIGFLLSFVFRWIIEQDELEKSKEFTSLDIVSNMVAWPILLFVCFMMLIGYSIENIPTLHDKIYNKLKPKKKDKSQA